MMLLVSAASATTIYCKVDKSWWMEHDAAVGIYAWNEGGEMLAWPGAPMTPVDGEEGQWSYDLDLELYDGCAFSRINADGEYWGAKTEDLTIPSDGSNLFTITNEEGINNAVVTKAVKRIVNGQLLIERNGKFINALGA